MTGIYFSGTGNTKHCVEEFLSCLNTPHVLISIEDIDQNTVINDDTIILGYPTCFSNMPMIIRDFIKTNNRLFAGKKVFIIVTMGLFSGDGAGCSARLLKKYGATIIGGLHVQMPDCIGDEKMLKKSLGENRAIVKRANEKIHAAARKFKDGQATQNGLNILHHIAGLFGQRLWFYGKSTSYKNKPQINLDKCVSCGLCVKQCPMKNLALQNGVLTHYHKCTMCYRCVNNCPKQALTILGKQVLEQCVYERYK